MHTQMLDRVKEQERQSYSELQQELKSLKSLLLSSRDSAMASTPSIFSQIGKKPSIPAWQLAQSASPPVSGTPTAPTSFASSAAPASTPTPLSPTPFYTANGLQDDSSISKD
jgi:peroxin-14